MTIWSSPAVAEVNGRAVLAVGSYDSKLYCLDPANGDQLWTFTAGAAVSATRPSGTMAIGSGSNARYPPPPPLSVVFHHGLAPSKRDPHS